MRGRKTTNYGRELGMIELFKKGIPMPEIGDEFCVSRQYVHQILKKHGLSAKDGGNTFVRLRKKQSANKASNEKYMARVGMGKNEYKNMDRKIKLAFYNQKHGAKKRDIGWEFIFKDWWDVWRDSGKWEERGRGYGYCMARNGDLGPYKMGNVYIATCAKNTADQYVFRKRTIKF